VAIVAAHALDWVRYRQERRRETRQYALRPATGSDAAHERSEHLEHGEGGVACPLARHAGRSRAVAEP
jgi:hypothetical protein